jgi:hypothetical protein
MKTITIIFIGMIIHVNQPWSFDNTAVLPYEKDHVAELRIPVGAVVEPDEWIKKKLNRSGDTYVIALPGLDVRVKGTRGVFSRKRDDFMAAVPSLRKIAPKCGKLRPEVVDRKQVAEKLASYIDYRGGRVMPHTFLPLMLFFSGVGNEWKTEHCVVCEVLYKAKLRHDEALLVIKGDGEPKRVHIAGDSTLEVHNLPKDGGDGHFIHHYNVFKPCEDAKLPSTGGKCKSGTICAQAMIDDDGDDAPAPGEDCTNSQWP